MQSFDQKQQATNALFMANWKQLIIDLLAEYALLYGFGTKLWLSRSAYISWLSIMCDVYVEDISNVVVYAAVFSFLAHKLSFCVIKFYDTSCGTTHLLRSY